MGKTGEKIKRSFQYALLAVAIGVLVGILDTIFGRGLLIISDIRNLHYRYLIPFCRSPVWLSHGCINILIRKV